MKNIILLPLDERPCNFDFPSKIFNGEKYTVIRPEKLGQKKTPADFDAIKNFLLENIPNADAAVISMDTLLYGGLIPSRLHMLSKETVEERLALLKTLREMNPGMKLYVFQCIMRCPKYSSNDEEPRGKAAGAIYDELQKFIEKELTSIADRVTLKEVWLPWSRMFEIGLRAEYKAD